MIYDEIWNETICVFLAGDEVQNIQKLLFISLTFVCAVCAYACGVKILETFMFI